MDQQTCHKPSSPLRRSPRLHSFRHGIFVVSPDATSRQPIQDTPTLRQRQLHESVERINIPTSVDPGAGAIMTASDVRQISSNSQQTRELRVHATGVPSSTEREFSASKQTSSGDQLTVAEESRGVSRRVQLRSSVKPVNLPTSIEILPASSASPRDRLELSSDEQELGSSLPDPDVAFPQGNSSCGAELIMEEDEHENLRASQGDDKAGVFTFLYRMSVRKLRKLLKSMKLKQQGNKGELVARFLVDADIRLAAGDTIAQIMASHHATARYESWVQHQCALDERVLQYWPVAPSLQQLLLKLGNRERDEFKKKKAAVLRSREGLDAIGVGQQVVHPCRPEARNQPVVRNAVENINFSISEFARLCIIMRDDEDAKAALLATEQELTRSQMDAGFSRESFWGVIEGRFNDADLQLCLSMVGNVDEVDSTQPPPSHRSASFLKERFFDAHSSFTLCVENWSKSGQNETDNFKSFAGTRSGELTAAGKRNMVLFVCAGMGTENEDSRFRRMCMRTIPHGRDIDEGGSAAPLSEESSVQAAGTAGSRRGSRRNSGREKDSVDQALVQLSEYIIERGRQRLISDEEKREERQERRQQWRERHEEAKQRAMERHELRKRKSGENELRQLEENHKLIKLLRYTTETLKSLGQDPGTELVVATRRQHEAIFRAFRMPENSLEGLQGDMSMSGNYGHRIQITGEGRRDDNTSDEHRRDDHSIPERGNDDDQILSNV